MDRKTLLAKHAEYLFPCVASYYKEPVVAASAKGCQITDTEGREYLDLFGGILTVSLSHCQPEVVEAISEQARTLGHTSTLYPTANLVAVAERLSEITPGALKKCFFTSSGSEADETAVMLAKVYSGKQEIIALRHGYHGRTHLSMGLTAHASWRALPAQIPGIVHAPSPYCYRCPFGLEHPSCDLRCAHDLEELIITVTSGSPAAFLAEPIQGVGGFITPPADYFKVAVDIVRKHGGIFICDEVQTGFGRTGGKWCGIEHFGVEPEIMTFAKGIANGMPVGATIAIPEIADSLQGLSIATFGGNPVSMAATAATLEVMDREDVPGRCAERGAQLREHLLALENKYSIIGDVRGMGLMQALELVEDRKSKVPAAAKTAELMEVAKGRGLLLGKGGLYGNTIRMSPPMLISAAEIDEAMKLLDQSLADIS